jgi:hypothetical protein
MTMMTGKKYQGTNAKATKGGAEGRSNKAAEDDGGAREGVRREKVGGRAMENRGASGAAAASAARSKQRTRAKIIHKMSY